MRVLFLDCFSGISGDMTVGALCDLGVKPSTFEWELAKLDIGDFHLHFGREKRQNIEGVKFGVHAGAVHTHEQDEEPEEHGQVHVHANEEDGHGHGHSHEHHDHEEHEHGDSHEGHEHAGHSHEGHAHDHSHADHEHDEHAHGRSYLEIQKLLMESDLSGFVKKHALSIFRRVAEAEAKIHGTTVEAVGFHEVGALDSITDIVCACVGMEELGVEKVFVGPLADGRGWVDCAHGRFPIPAPATLEILRGVPVGQVDEPYEFITPTGAAIAAEFGVGFGPMPAMTVEKIGYGLGARRLPNRPNVLRAVLGEMAEEGTGGRSGRFSTDTVTQIETNLDDLSPEIVGAVMERLLVAGALDVFFLPAQMKKSRPGILLTVLCEMVDAERMGGIILTETSAFGVRMSVKRRLKLERRVESVKTEYGEIEVKLGFDRAGKRLQAAPEYESCRAAAERAGVGVREVYRVAMGRGMRDEGGRG